jgi:hypothetical protein
MTLTFDHIDNAAVGGRLVAECEKNQSHAKTVRNTHTVFVSKALNGHYRAIYDAAVVVIDTFFMAAHDLKVGLVVHVGSLSQSGL